MKLPRGRFLHLAVGAAGCVADGDGADLRPDRLMVGYAADTDRYTCNGEKP